MPQPIFLPMPKLSVKAIIYKKNKKPTDKATIAIRVTYQGQSRFSETKYRVQINQWDEDKETVLPTYVNYRMANTSIQKKKSTIERDLLTLQETEDFDITTIENYLASGDLRNIKHSFTDFVLKYIDEQKGKKADGTVNNYIKQLAKVQRFAGKEQILFSEVTSEFLKKYETWLRSLPKRPNKPNTIWDSITKFFRKFFKLAGKSIKGFNHNPFNHYDKPNPVSTHIEYWVMDELDKLEEKLDSLPANEYMIACYFLLECYSGIRHGDWKRFKVEKLIEGDSLKVIAKKNKEPIYLSLSNRPRLKALLERIKHLPYTGELYSTNIKLKVIAAKVGVDKRTSTHVGRHTCAVLHAERGFSKEYVCQLLAITMPTVETYYKITRQKLRKEDERLQGL